MREKQRREMTLHERLSMEKGKSGKEKPFPYTKEACRCRNCLYHKNEGCVLRTCCCMDERVRAHTCTFAQAMNVCFVNIKDFVSLYPCGLPWKERRKSGAAFWERSIKDGFTKELSERREKTMPLRQALFACGNRDALEACKALYVCEWNWLCGSGHDGRHSGGVYSVLCSNGY